ncbi:MAG: VanZ family protein [Bacteroidales bacterium]
MIRKNIYSFSVALVIIILSFTGPSTFDRLKIPDLPYLDKLVHLGMYAALMFVLIIENRKNLLSARSYLYLSLIPLFFGLLIEILQSMFTVTRTGDVLDLAADAAGIVLAVLFWLIIRRLFSGEHRDQIRM